MIDNLLAYLNVSWVGAVLTIITFIIALIVGYFFYTKGKPNKSLKNHSETFLIIDRSKADSPEQIEIFFLGDKVESLYKTLIYFWNDGNQTIKADDLETIDRLKISTKESAKILSINIVKNTRDVINFYLAKDEDGYQINFDYLDPTDGVVIEILHTGQPDNLNFSGTVIGILDKIGVYKNKNKFLSGLANGLMDSLNLVTASKKKPKTFGSAIALVGATVIVLGIYTIFSSSDLLEKALLESRWSLIVVGFLYFILGIYFIYSNQTPFPKSLKLNKLNKNEELT